MNKINVLFLASEADPFIKIGGLGDVAGSLPNALLELGNDLDVRLIIPNHKQLNFSNFLVSSHINFDLLLGKKPEEVQVYKTNKEDLDVFFISGEAITSKESVYDHNIEKDGEKYIFFDLAAMEFLKLDGWKPDIVIANDWHTAISLHAIKQRHNDIFWKNVKTIIIIHNLCYMGAGTEAILDWYGIGGVETDKIPWWGKHVPLTMGMLSADKIVTVSPSYAKEIQTSEYGCGLESYFQSRKKDVTGIVNGIDLKFWDPSTDKGIKQTFSIDEIDSKVINKKFLQNTFGLKDDPSIPLLAMVTRMDQQKGVDILVEAIELIADRNFQIIILGTGNIEIEKDCQKLEEKYPSKVRAIIKYDGRISRQIYAGADMILMPSRYEPCGIAQMISMRYGSVPIARSTGGLKDTISEGKTGFLFKHINSVELSNSMVKAMNIFNDRTAWRLIQHNCMKEDFSWKKSAKKYKKLFLELMKE